MSSAPYKPDFRATPDRRRPASPFGPAAMTQAVGPGGVAEPPTLRPQILRSLRMRPRLAIAVGAMVALVMVVLAMRQPQVYQAQSLVYVEPVVARNLNEQGAPGFDQFRYGSFVDQQMQTATRPDVLAEALRTLPKGIWQRPKETSQAAVLRLQKALVVERLLTSYQMSIKLKADTGSAAAAIVNAVTDAYLQSGRNDEISMSKERQTLLTEERERIREELQADQKEQAALGDRLGVANPENSLTNPFDAETANLRLQLAAARQAHDVAEAQLSSISGADEKHRLGLAASADETLITDLGLGSMKSAVNARRALLQSQMAGLTANNPVHKQDQEELTDLDRSLDSMTTEMRSRAERHIQDKLRTDLQRTADVESQLNHRLAQETARASGAGPKLQRASELAVDMQRLHAQYTSVDDALNALEIQTRGPGMAHVALTAAVPAAPEPNRRGLFLMAALPLAACFGSAAAVLARLRDRRVYTGSDLEDALGFAPIAVLPSASEVPLRVREQYVLRLAAGIENAYRTAGAQTFILTGVSATCDTRSLLDELTTRLEHMRLDVVVRDAGGLLLVSKESGEHFAANEIGRVRTANTGEGIAASRLERLKTEHGIILIDGAPLLHSAETEYAARCADATILVVQSGITLSTEVVDAASLLGRLRVVGIGAVLEGLSLEHADASFREAVGFAERRELEGDNERSRVPQAIYQVPSAQVALASAPVLEAPVLEEAIVDSSQPVMIEPVALAVSTPESSVAEVNIEAIAEPVEVPSPAVFEEASTLEQSATLHADAEELTFEQAVAEEPVYSWALPVGSDLVTPLPLTTEQADSTEVRASDAPAEVEEAEPFTKAFEPMPDLAETTGDLSATPSSYEEVEAVVDHYDAYSFEPPSEAPPLDLTSPVVNLGPTLLERHAPALAAVTEDFTAPETATTESTVPSAAILQSVSGLFVVDESLPADAVAAPAPSAAKQGWFARLLRGATPSSVIPGPAATRTVDDNEWHTPAKRLPELTGPQDPELEHLLKRINSRVYFAPPALEAAAQTDALTTLEDSAPAVPGFPPSVASDGPDSFTLALEGSHRSNDVLAAFVDDYRLPAQPSIEQSISEIAARGNHRPSGARITELELSADVFANAFPDTFVERPTEPTPPPAADWSLPKADRSSARFDPIVPLRDEPAPWHERLTASRANVPAATKHRSAERLAFKRESSSSMAALAPRLTVAAGAQLIESLPDPVPSARPAYESGPSSSERALSRRWGLLSQYDGIPTEVSTGSRTLHKTERGLRLHEDSEKRDA